MGQVPRLPTYRPEGLRKRPVYLDYNATTPVDPRVVEAALPYLTVGFGNPSSAHAYGAAPHEAVERARNAVAALIGASCDGDRAGDVVFTGSGSEANLLALRGCVLSPTGPRRHLITQATEHPAVLATCEALVRHHAVDLTILQVDGDGLLDPALLEQTLRRPSSARAAGERTLVSVMTANNETGALQPIAALSDIAHRYGALLHSDAAQAGGKIPLDVDALGVDLLTVVGHKMYAPKGIAALYVRAGLDLEPVVYGGGQEGGRRAGTESVALIAALGRAAELASLDLADGAGTRLTSLRDALHDALREGLPGRVQLNGPPSRRLPNTLNLSLSGVVMHDVLPRLAAVAASAGSACHSGVDTPSPVLTAMGISRDRALAAVRLSLGRWSTEEDVTVAVDALTSAASAA